jgi:hypothetical protein
MTSFENLLEQVASAVRRRKKTEIQKWLSHVSETEYCRVSDALQGFSDDHGGRSVVTSVQHAWFENVIDRPHQQLLKNLVDHGTQKQWLEQVAALGKSLSKQEAFGSWVIVLTAQPTWLDAPAALLPFVDKKDRALIFNEEAICLGHDRMDRFFESLLHELPKDEQPRAVKFIVEMAIHGDRLDLIKRLIPRIVDHEADSLSSLKINGSVEDFLRKSLNDASVHTHGSIARWLVENTPCQVAELLAQEIKYEDWAEADKLLLLMPAMQAAHFISSVEKMGHEPTAILPLASTRELARQRADRVEKSSASLQQVSPRRHRP